MKNTVTDVLKSGAQKLAAAHIDEAQANAEFLLGAVLNRQRTWLSFNGAAQIRDEEINRYQAALDVRIKGVPLAYITGTQDFCGHTFFVDEDVLIPRPETEELVEKTIKKLQNPRRLLDMCAGSGVIACTLAMKYRNAEIIGADNSPAALLTAQKNADKFKLLVQFIYGDLFENIFGVFDAVISNPPYIASGDIEGLSKEVKFEPRAALDGGPDGLDVITQIILYAPDFLESGGLLALEFGINQEEKIKAIFDKNIWDNIVIEKDFAGIRRFIFARKK
ncbi:MAG: peptide chain release factor N(5)-glutamine methyltransferase [Elusimicrobium sp.]|jgi:release factor glutamine methyltransferase|nr:peptide chain release factor N(5)-glutamine methyltransferase [Elusimicrobium sp.]